MNDAPYDFSRSFLQFTTDHAFHTPRLQIEASCVFAAPGAPEREFFLPAACIAERMYHSEYIVHQPPSEFWMMAENNGEFVMQKHFAASSRDVREVWKVGDRMSTHDGHGATMKKIDVAMRRAARFRPLSAYGDIREAILANRTIVGRTSYALPDGVRVRLNYPIKVCNIANEKEAWQIDSGPIVAVDPALAGGPVADRLRLAYVLYNAWDWAEFAFYAPVALEGGVSTTAYSRCVRVDGLKNELFVIDDT